MINAQGAIQRGFAEMNSASQRASAGHELEGILEQNLATRQIEASLKVAATMNETLGTLIHDIA